MSTVGLSIREQPAGPRCDTGSVPSPMLGIPLRKRFAAYGMVFWVPDWREDAIIRWCAAKGETLYQCYKAAGITELLPPYALGDCVLEAFKAHPTAGGYTCLQMLDCFGLYVRWVYVLRAPSPGPLPPEGWVDPTATPYEPGREPLPLEPTDGRLVLICLEARHGYSEATSRALQESILAKYPKGVTGPVEQMTLLTADEQAFVRAAMDCEANPEAEPPPAHHHQPHEAAAGRGAVTALIVAAGVLAILSR